MPTGARILKIDSASDARLTNLENNVYKITYYEIVSGTSGTITPPTGATFNANEFGDSGDSILSKINVDNKPTFSSPTTTGGVVVTANLNPLTGAWTTSGTYTDASVALIYSINISAADYSNLNNFYIIESEENVTSTLLTGYSSTTGVISSSDTILTAIEKLNGNIAAIPPSTLLGVSNASLTVPNSVYQMTSTIPVEFKTSDANTLLYLDETNERVGVGTSSPTTKFHIAVPNAQDVINLTKADDIYTYMKLSLLGGATALYFGNGSGTVTTLGSYSNQMLLTQNLHISSAGYSGVNTGSKLTISQAPTASSNYGLVSLGSGAFDGSTPGFYVGSASGTLIAGNLVSGSTSDLLNLQVGGVSKYKIDSDGNTTVTGSLTLNYVAVTTTYSILPTDYTVNATSGTFTITLPTAVGITGKVYNLHNTGSGIITIATTSGETIDGNASGVLTLVQYDNLKVQSTGATYIIIN